MRKFLILLFITASLTSVQAQKWYQAGFKISTNIALNRDYADDICLSKVRNMYFNGYFRAGKIIFGEVGLGYHFFKGTYTLDDGSQSLLETRYLAIPIKVVADLKVGRHVSFLPQVGISYQPLLKLAGDVITFNKSMVENHWTMLTAGIDLRIGFIVLGVDYRYSFQNFFRNRGGEKPQFINIGIGVQF